MATIGREAISREWQLSHSPRPELDSLESAQGSQQAGRPRASASERTAGKLRALDGHEAAAIFPRAELTLRPGTAAGPRRPPPLWGSVWPAILHQVYSVDQLVIGVT